MAWSNVYLQFLPFCDTGMHDYGHLVIVIIRAISQLAICRNSSPWPNHFRTPFACYCSLGLHLHHYELHTLIFKIFKHVFFYGVMLTGP
jgi:hypothetical protein